MSPDYKIYWETPRDHMRERCFDFQAFLINVAQVKLQTGDLQRIHLEQRSYSAL